MYARACVGSFDNYIRFTSHKNLDSAFGTALRFKFEKMLRDREKRAKKRALKEANKIKEGDETADPIESV